MPWMVANSCMTVDICPESMLLFCQDVMSGGGGGGGEGGDGGGVMGVKGSYCFALDLLCVYCLS